MTNKIKTNYPMTDVSVSIVDPVAGASHVPELIPGTVTVGSVLTEEQMKLQYSRLAPSDKPGWGGCRPGPQEDEYSSLAPSPNPGWTYCPGSLTKKGNPK